MKAEKILFCIFYTKQLVSGHIFAGTQPGDQNRTRIAMALAHSPQSSIEWIFLRKKTGFVGT